MTDTLNLLPCPFCGGEPVLVEHESHAHSAMLKALVSSLPDHPGSWSIECCDVGMIKATPDEVVNAWNRRASPGPNAAVAAIQFALDVDDGTELDFLRVWNEGEFDVIRTEWPEAPEDVFIGADPLHPTPKHRESQEG